MIGLGVRDHFAGAKGNRSPLQHSHGCSLRVSASRAASAVGEWTSRRRVRSAW
jgi:hypothetical protein